MTEQTTIDQQVQIKRLRHQIGVSEQNYRYSGSQKHWDKAQACKAELKELLAQI